MLLLLFALGSCGQTAVRDRANAAAETAETAGMPNPAEPAAVQLAEMRPDRVEVLVFHARRRCPTCVVIERLTREVTAAEFARALADSSLVLRVVNIDEEEALAEQYRVAWSSLLLHGRRQGADTVVNLTRQAFGQARRHPDAFRTALKREIENLLGQ